MLSRLLIPVLALLIACAPAPEFTGRAATGPLAAFEDASLMPPEIVLLPLDPGRAWALLVQVPAPAVVDLSDPRAAQRGLAAFRNPVAVWRAGTALGHVMVGWRCAAGETGLVSKSGETRQQGRHLLERGWGLGALLARYDDGHLVTLEDLPASHRRVLRTGQARIVAIEISESGCQSMRRAVLRALDDPDIRHYTQTASADYPYGAGCGGFALELAMLGGALRDQGPALLREVVLRDSFVGQGAAPEAGILPFPTAAYEPISLFALLSNDWTQGAEIGRVRLLDMELLLLLLDLAGETAGIVRMPRLTRDGAAQRSTVAAARHWLAGFARATPVRIGAAQALVLHRQ